MAYPKVLLISLQPDLSIVGFKRIHYYLRAHGFDSVLLHNTHYNPADARALDKLRRFTESVSPLFIGLSLMSTEYDQSRHLSGYLREHFPDLPILWGGIHPTIAPETCLPHADYACVGEGELTALEFAEALAHGRDPRGINNLAYLEGGEPRRNPLHPLIEDLDSLPIVDHIAAESFLQESGGTISRLNARLTLRYGRYQGKFYDMLTSIGCPFSCTYCCSSAIAALYGVKKVRQRSVESCIEELARAASDNEYILMINFQDENLLSHGLDYLREFGRAYRERVGLPFMLACIPLFATPDKVAALKEAGLIWVRMGLQSGSDRVCKEVYQRGSLQKNFQAAMDTFQRNRVAVYCDVIMDNPFETDQDRLETVAALAAAPRPFYLQLYSLSAYHGTAIRRRMEEECPRELEDTSRKDYFQLKKTTLNMMTRLAPYLPRPFSRALMRGFREDREGLGFKIAFLAAKIMGIGLFEPLALLRVLILSQGGSFPRVVRSLPAYIRIAVVRYLTRFRPR